MNDGGDCRTAPATPGLLNMDFFAVVYVVLVAGYQKALERGNSVARPKGFCEANKVELSAVLPQHPKCCDLRLIDILIFDKNISFYWYFWQVVKL